jgi:hypothetical protein
MKNKKPEQQLYEDPSEKMKKVVPDAEVELNPLKELKEIEEIDKDLIEVPHNGPLEGSDLDIPGAELDDEAESIGSEDEENNYYSIGGDNHDNLEENNDNNS